MSFRQHLNQHQPQLQQQIHSHPHQSCPICKSWSGGPDPYFIGPPHFQYRRQTSLTISTPTSTHIHIKVIQLKDLGRGSSSIFIGPPHFQCRRQTSLSISSTTSTHINVEVIQFENLGRGVFVCDEPEDLEVASIPFHCPHLRWASLLRNLNLTTFNTNYNNYNSRCKNHLVNWLHVPRTVEGCGLSSKNDAWNGNPQVAQTLRTCNIMIMIMVMVMMMMMMLEKGRI